jgi:hypothetical protein
MAVSTARLMEHRTGLDAVRIGEKWPLQRRGCVPGQDVPRNEMQLASRALQAWTGKAIASSMHNITFRSYAAGPESHVRPSRADQQ